MNISEKARRQILDNLIIIGECFGTNGRAVDFVNRVALYYRNTGELERHMDRFKDWTYDQLFYDELGLLLVDDKQFEDFCSGYMNPVFVRKKRLHDEYEELHWEDLNPRYRPYFRRRGESLPSAGRSPRRAKPAPAT